MKQHYLITGIILTLFFIQNNASATPGKSNTPAKAIMNSISENIDGPTVQTATDGTKIINNQDGSSVQIHADGSLLVINSDGSTIQKNADGSESNNKI